jgi:hypothetical protein
LSLNTLWLLPLFNATVGSEPIDLFFGRATTEQVLNGGRLRDQINQMERLAHHLRDFQHNANDTWEQVVRRNGYTLFLQSRFGFACGSAKLRRGGL